jgi:hypothetical protein
MADFTIKQHDTRPVLTRYLIQTVNGATSPVDLTAVSSVGFKMRNTSAQTVLVTGIASVVTISSAYIAYKWAVNDTATNGIYNAEYELTYSDGGVETVPNGSYFSIEVVDDLDLP